MIANSVLISLIGFFVGPTFPLVLDIATNQNTKQTQGVSLILYLFIMC
jgi:fucose permease